MSFVITKLRHKEFIFTSKYFNEKSRLKLQNLQKRTAGCSFSVKCPDKHLTKGLDKSMNQASDGDPLHDPRLILARRR
jgi:hypothetical protein